MPRRSRAVHLLSERAQSPESQMTRPEDITSRCSVPGPRSKVQGSAAVDTAYTANFGSCPPEYLGLVLNTLRTTVPGEQSPAEVSWPPEADPVGPAAGVADGEGRPEASGRAEAD